MTETQDLIQYVVRTHEIDESGDATFLEFLTEYLDTWACTHTDGSLVEMFQEYLVWANGPDWRDFLDNAKIGDIPPK